MKYSLCILLNLIKNTIKHGLIHTDLPDKNLENMTMIETDQSAHGKHGCLIDYNNETYLITIEPVDHIKVKIHSGADYWKDN